MVMDSLPFAGMTIRHIIVVLFILCLSPLIIADPDPDLLFPYGEDAGDTKWTNVDEGSWTVSLSGNLTIFDVPYTDITISENGMIQFGTSLTLDWDNTRQLPRDQNLHILFPFWVDWDFRRGDGTQAVYMREVVDGDPDPENDLDRASETVETGLQESTLDSATYGPILGAGLPITYVLVITFENGTYWGGSADTPTNTIQVVIASDMTSYTWAFYHYAKVDWIQMGHYARIALDNGGDEDTLYENPFSASRNLYSMTEYSNVDVNGRIMFQLTNVCDNDDCYPGACVSTTYCMCPDGYSGDNCEVTPCSSTPCYGGECTDVVDGYHCTCTEHWIGTDCHNMTHRCDPDPCVHGDCAPEESAGKTTDFVCTCDPGYEGRRCDIEINECSSCPCVYGQCIDQVANYTCNCFDDYSGYDCESKVDDCINNQCVNGTCVDGIDQYSCFCEEGYTGEFCADDIDDCDTNPCTRGSCIDYVNSYSCQCPSNYYGQNCDVEYTECDDSPCLYGICTSTVGSFTCSCDPGYSGTLCDYEIPPMCKTAQCPPNSYCVEDVPTYSCPCLSGYTGASCETNIDDCTVDPCVHGTCVDLVDEYECQCEAGYTGKHCRAEINWCRVDVCHHGSCGRAENTCDCDEGFTGDLCEVNADDCLPEICNNNGTCLDGPDTYDCTCVPGYEGVNCDNPIDECVSSPCGYGQCVDVVDGYVCVCPEGVTGESCENDTRIPIGSRGEWGLWSVCTKSCDNGLQRRYRPCLREPCMDSNSQEQLCNTQRCRVNPAETDYMFVQLETLKPALNVAQEENALLAVVAQSVNRYCDIHRAICCRVINITVPTSTDTFDAFDAHHVAIVSGYPAMVNNHSIRMTLMLKARVQNIRRFCLDRNPPVVNELVNALTASPPIYIPHRILQDALHKDMQYINEVTCCWSLISRRSGGTTSIILIGALIPVCVLVVIAGVFALSRRGLLCFTKNEKLYGSEASENPWNTKGDYY